MSYLYFILLLLLYVVQHLNVFGKGKVFPYPLRLKIIAKYCVCFILA